ncbi:MAG: class I SAM-dependent methyltransferase, partial [Bacteroidales bacterium]|nr:class I SAM-dependent methyltransferase [Bacteroidales bacterium]
MNFNDQRLREQHSLMEGQRSSSYAIFADAPEYWFSYDAYLDTFRQYVQRKGTVNILNIGAATGILEYLALRDIYNLHFVSVDNSKDFTDLFCQKNAKGIKYGMVEHVFSPIQDFKTNQKFDIIIARDFNHHIEIEDIKK